MDLDLFLKLSAPGKHSWVYLNKEVSASRVHAGAITQQKGDTDESESVRRAHRSGSFEFLHNLIRRPRRFAEKSFVWIQWHGKTRPAPRFNGTSYLQSTQPGASELVDGRP